MAYNYPTITFNGRVLADGFSPIYYANAFTQPYYPVILSADGDSAAMFRWGLIPPWCKTLEAAAALVKRTVNARAETVFVRPAFRFAARHQRCIVPVTGFYEWHDCLGKKYPFFITAPEGRPFFIAGIQNRWRNPATDETIPTFCLLTTDANELLAKIHNLKKRMPVILAPTQANLWLDPTTPIETLKSLLVPYSGPLDAWPVAKISPTSANQNRPETQKPFDYPQLYGFHLGFEDRPTV